MSLRHAFFLLGAVALLAACTADEKAATSDALDKAGTETTASYNKARNMFDVGHKTKQPVQQPAQSRYCYHTYEDVICYSRPLPGEEYRLTGFQTPQGKTGYVIDPPAAPDDASADLPPLKAVTVPTPTPVKGTDDSQLKEIIFDPAELQPKELVPQKQE